MITIDTQNKLRERFNPEGSLLRKHQYRMFEMLQYLDSLCKEHHIKYWLSSGTLLGAVRHGGFIPWDDDLDIEMLREDYLRLEKILEKETVYDFQSYKTDPFYRLPFGKLRDKNSQIEEHGRDIDYKYKGIFVDLFIMEYSHSLSARGVFWIIRQITAFSLKSNNPTRKKIFLSLKKIIFNIIPIIRFIDRLIPRRKLCHTYGASCRIQRKSNELFPLSEVTFEGQTFPAPRDSDAYLRRIFGNYNELPNEEQIAPHISTVRFFE